MPTYLIFVRWTDQGRKNFRATVERGVIVDRLLASVGATVKGHYWTLDESDVVIVAEAPDEESVRAVALEIQSRGNSHITVQRGYDDREMAELIERADRTVAAT